MPCFSAVPSCEQYNPILDKKKHFALLPFQPRQFHDNPSLNNAQLSSHDPSNSQCSGIIKATTKRGRGAAWLLIRNKKTSDWGCPTMERFGSSLSLLPSFDLLNGF